MKFRILLACLLPGTSIANCTDLIALAKERSVIIEDQDKYKRNVRLFCSEYSNSQGSSSSSSFEGAYKYISASFGKSGMSKSDLNQKVCDSSDLENSSHSAYRSYLQTIAPEAFNSYNRCVEWSEKDIKISLPPSSVLPNELSLSAGYSSRVTGSEANLSVHTSGDVSCHWNKSEADEIKLSNGSSASLNCSRKSSNRKSFINVIRNNEDTKPMSISWQAYDDEGNPVNKLRDLQNELNAFSGAVVSFESTRCPKGWEVYTKAYGRFIRGIDRGDAPNNDPDGEREPGSVQEDTFRKHDHAGRVKTFQPEGHGGPGHENVNAKNSTGHEPWKVPEQGGDETRPKNVALLYCKKN